MQSQNIGTVVCSECGTRVSIDDAESCYNAELDDVYFVCTKCIEDENRQSPAVSDDGDEAVEQMRAADVAKASAERALQSANEAAQMLGVGKSPRA